MAAINVKLSVQSAGLLSQPLSLTMIDSIVATGVVATTAKTITATVGGSVKVLDKTDYTDSDDQAMVIVKNTGGTYDLYLEVTSGVEAMKLKPGQFAMFPWHTDNTTGNDIYAYASNATGTSIEITVIEIS